MMIIIMRLLMIVGVLFLIAYLAAFWFRRKVLRMVKQFAASQEEASAAVNLTERLVECHYCHTFFPISRATKSQNQLYCCQEHADLSK
jgi:hypothetical protein